MIKFKRFFKASFPRGFSSFKSNRKLIELAKTFEKYDINSYFLPNNDEHNSEYLSKTDKRIKFISGFTGSNALTFISNNEAILWTDSRYFIQAKKELQEEWIFKEISANERKWFEFVIEKHKFEKKPFIIGFDPSLVSATFFEEKSAEFSKNGIELKPIQKNLIDNIWEKPKDEAPKQLFIHDVKYAGLSLAKKLDVFLNKTQEFNNKIRFILLTELDEIAWLLNLRGGDIPYNPVFKSYLLIEFDNLKKYKGFLFIDLEKITEEIGKDLTDHNIMIKAYEEISSVLSQIDKPILINKSICNYSLYKCIPAAFIINEKSPLKSLKAVKNSTEIAGYKNAHIRDGLSVIRFLTWLKLQLLSSQRTLNEYEAAVKCDELRSLNENFKGLSFKTISSSGANSAIVHYSPEVNNSSQIDINSMYLLDSGGHYWDGTTDITRTMHFSKPKIEEKMAYTLVLRGNLDLERTIWPDDKEIMGSDLDVIARRNLWLKGLDYGHGTGHGVGHFLNVHEGPHGISKKTSEILKENMILTNEPGYYKEEAFGIRIENCLVIKKTGIANFLGFENLTLVPYDLNLIERSLLQKEDIDYINKYHKKIREIYLPILERNNENNEENWLKEATSEIIQ